MKSLEDQVLSFIRENALLTDGEPVLVGFSGGMDSVTLLSMLYDLGYAVTAVHVHHGLRGEEADRDAAFAEKFCFDRNIPFIQRNVDVPAYAKEKHLSVETAARILRYRVFDDLCQKHQTKIAVAHHRSDQAETVLAHMIRGCGLDGLIGMKPLSGIVIRPLLNVSKTEIEQYIKEKGLPFVTDSTNLLPDGTRNALRLNVIPELNRVRLHAEDAIASCAARMAKLKNWLDGIVEEKFREKAHITADGVLLPFEDDEFLFSELIRRAVMEVRQSLVDLDEEKINEIAALKASQVSKEKVYFETLHVQRSYDGLLFYEKENDFAAEFPFRLGSAVSWKDGIIETKIVPERTKLPESECVDGDKIPSNAVLRTRQPGDYLSPLGMQGRVSLKEYLIDKKIPQNHRDSLVLLASGHEIYAILGVTVSEKCRVTDQTKTIIMILKEKRQ